MSQPAYEQKTVLVDESYFCKIYEHYIKKVDSDVWNLVETTIVDDSGYIEVI